MVAAHATNLKEFSKQFSKLYNKKVCIFVFTSNEEKFIRESFKNKIATAFYVDSWDLIKKGKCTDLGCAELISLKIAFHFGYFVETAFKCFRYFLFW